MKKEYRSIEKSQPDVSQEDRIRGTRICSNSSSCIVAPLAGDELYEVRRDMVRRLVGQEKYECHFGPKAALHCRGVGQVMVEYTGAPEAFVLGYLHDIGKMFSGDKHPQTGAELLKNSGYDLWREIAFHGAREGEEDYRSLMLDVLNMADLTVNAVGEIVGYAARLEDIKERYGEDSPEYANAKRIVRDLKERGFQYLP